MTVGRAIMTAFALVCAAAAQETVFFPTQDGGLIYADLYGTGNRGRSAHFRFVRNRTRNLREKRQKLDKPSTSGRIIAVLNRLADRLRLRRVDLREAVAYVRGFEQFLRRSYCVCASQSPRVESA